MASLFRGRNTPSSAWPWSAAAECSVELIYTVRPTHCFECRQSEQTASSFHRLRGRSTANMLICILNRLSLGVPWSGYCG